MTALIIAMKRGGTTVLKERAKKTIRQTVWLTDQWRQILERLEEKTGANKAEIMRWALADLARNQGVFLEKIPGKSSSR
jgi:hypothetical protein